VQVNLLTFGTRGDVQPALALGLGLEQAGFDVQIVAFEEFRSFIEEYGLAFIPLDADLQNLLTRTSGEKMFRGTGAFELIKLFRLMIASMFTELLTKSQDCDLLISNPATAMFANSIAEKLGIPHIETTVFPGWPTRAFPSFFGPWPTSWGIPRGGFWGWVVGGLNRFSYKPVNGLVWLSIRPIIERCRVEILDLPKKNQKSVNTQPPPILAGFSEYVLPIPPDWPKTVHLSGYWFLDTPAFKPPASLLTFLNSGSPPVYVGFGSMPSEDPVKMTELVLQALEMSGQRGILHTGNQALGYGMTKLPPESSAYFVDSIPHDWLMPHTAAVAHHGGAGTTAAGIRAGVPSILIPIGADQRLWAFRVEQLGVGPKAIPHAKLTAEKLAEAIHEVITDKDIQQKASVLGNKIREEDGVGKAVKIVCKYLGV
jgi:UDP:flavonoid glycosyltransferase YjiC (YdhE family)